MKQSRVRKFLTGMILLLMVLPVGADDLASIISVSRESVTVTITGVFFTTTKGEVRLEMSGETGIEANTISSWGTDTIVCKFIFDEDTEEGDWDLIVTRDTTTWN